MPRKVTVTVRPSAAHPDYLTISDAMLQIADAFTVLKGGEGSPVEWRLLEASTHSPPMHATAEWACTELGDVAGAGLIERAIIELAGALNGDELAEPDPVLERLLKRNLNGVGVTSIEFDDERPSLEITATVATVALAAINSGPFAAPPHRVRGSIEGELAEIGTFRSQPAVRIKTRNGGRAIWCKLTKELAYRFDDKVTFDDVWAGKRVRLRGWLSYRHDGNVHVIDAEKIELVTVAEVKTDSLLDADFTGGLDPRTYLERLRDGTLD